MSQDVFSSREILKIREGLSDSAVWQYHTHIDRLILSNAAQRMLETTSGIDTNISALVSSLRCDEGFSFDDFRAALVAGLLDGKSFEVVHSGRASRVLMMRYRRFTAANGQSERLDGLFIDVTTQHNALRMMNQRRKAAAELFEKIGFFEWQTDGFGLVRPSVEWLALTGQPLKEQPSNWQEMLTPESRHDVAEAVAKATADPAGGFFAYFSLRTLLGEKMHFISSGALVENDYGGRPEMSGRVLRRARTDENGTIEMTTAAAVRVASGHELRAARALLGWSMQDMAAAADVSISTVKRLEDGEVSIRASNLSRVVQALQNGGVSFLMTGRGQAGIYLRRD